MVGNAHGEFPSTTSSSTATSAGKRGSVGGFTDSDMWDHTWAPSKGSRGPDTYTDLAQAKAEAQQRQAERENRIRMEQREAEIEKREREVTRQQEMAAVENRRRLEAQEEAERRRKAKEDAQRRSGQPVQAVQPKKPAFNYEREKPQILISVANAIQAANNLVNAVRVSEILRLRSRGLTCRSTSTETTRASRRARRSRIVWTRPRRPAG